MGATNEEYIDALWIDREANQEKIKELQSKLDKLIEKKHKTRP